MLIRILVVGRNVTAPQQTTYSMIGMCDNHVTSLSFQKNSQKNPKVLDGNSLKIAKVVKIR
jgi:hypothetical protein